MRPHSLLGLVWIQNACQGHQKVSYKLAFYNQWVTHYHYMYSNFCCQNRLSLLSVSCSSANEFSAILFLPFARSSSNSLQSLEGFRRTLGPNFIQIRQWVNCFLIEPHCKSSSFRQRFNVADCGQSLQRGSMGKFFICCRIQLKFRPRISLKRWNDQGEFELDRAKSKNISPKIRLH